MDAQFRLARADDAQAIREVGIATWWATYTGLLEPHAIAAVLKGSWHIDQVRRLVAHEVYRVLVAELLGELVGVLFARWPQPQEATVVIERFYVRPDAQGRGLGYGLWRALVEALPEVVQTVELDVLVGNAQALAFYQRIGFIETHRFVDSLAGVPISLIYMRANRPFV